MFPRFLTPFQGALERVGHIFGTLAGPRVPMVSPLSFLLQIGWTPPIWHHLILW